VNFGHGASLPLATPFSVNCSNNTYTNVPKILRCTAKGRHSVDAKRDEVDHSKAIYSPIQQKVTTILRLFHKVTKSLRNFRCKKNNDSKNSLLHFSLKFWIFDSMGLRTERSGCYKK